MNNKLKILKSLSLLKTLRLNFYYLPLRKAIKFPFFISRHTNIRKLSGKVNLYCSIKPGMIRIGFDHCGLIDYRFERTIWEVAGIVEFYGNATFGSASRIIVIDKGKLVVNENVKITGRSSIIVAKEINIGKNCLISWDVQIMDTDFHKIVNFENKQINNDKNVLIYDKVWIGSRCNILKGAIIPEGSVIASNSLITGALTEKNCIYGGIPAKLIKSNIKWDF